MAIYNTYLVSKSTILLSPIISGGTVTTDGTYTYHTFTTSDTLIVDRSGKIDYLIVGGGSAGKYGETGGGGGGGGGFVRELMNQTITTGTYTVTVGAGASLSSNLAGSESSISTINSAPGGQGGGASTWQIGRSSGRGFVGGTAQTDNYGSGGGGDSANGKNASAIKAGNGGEGRLSVITGIRYGGGGGGGSQSNSSPSSIGIGADGGGDGGYNGANGTDAIANRGGGGGGGSFGSINGNGGRGGSGIVVIRYVTPV